MQAKQVQLVEESETRSRGTTREAVEVQPSICLTVAVENSSAESTCVYIVHLLREYEEAILKDRLSSANHSCARIALLCTAMLTSTLRELSRSEMTSVRAGWRNAKRQ